ncbi:MAG TPA: lysophospholipid acyltransferase family protein [bacterium]|nr:lysophospholipid acyltransferase family protein [bacterium]
MKTLKNLRYRLEHASVQSAARLLQALPLGVAQAAGRMAGRTAWALGVARAAANDNLAAYLGLSGAARRKVASAAYANFGQTMGELAWMPALDPAELDTMFTFEGLEQMQAAREAGKGIVCMSAHFGNWEWMGAALIRRGFKVTYLIGTQSNPWVDELFNRYRAKVGIQFVRISDIRGGLKVLKAGGLVALLGDQDGDKWGTFAPFFGAQASTHSIGELLARRSGSALAFGVPVRLGPRRHHLKVDMIPAPPEGLNEVQGTAWTLARYNALLEAAIREHPEHWLWMHHRWRSIPLHRLSGEARALAESGGIAFDTAAQAWHRVPGGEAYPVEGWK